MRYYKSGDFLHHDTANRAEESYDLLFGGLQPEASRDTVRLKPDKVLEKFSVVSLGATNTAYSEAPVLEIPSNITEGFGPLYTNGSVKTRVGVEHRFIPIGTHPVKLKTSGTIKTGDRAMPNSSGEATRGPGRLHCVSEISNGHAFFVLSFEPPIKNVRLEQVGGSSGDNVAPCTFTYNLFDLISGQQLNTTQGPVSLDTTTGVRHTGLKHIAAKKGEAYIDSNGDWVLIDCNERIVGGEC